MQPLPSEKKRSQNSSHSPAFCRPHHATNAHRRGNGHRRGKPEQHGRMPHGVCTRLFSVERTGIGTDIHLKTRSHVHRVHHENPPCTHRKQTNQRPRQSHCARSRRGWAHTRCHRLIHIPSRCRAEMVSARGLAPPCTHLRKAMRHSVDPTPLRNLLVPWRRCRACRSPRCRQP